MRESRSTLGQTFGTKKARKAIAALTENAIGPDRSARMLANGKTRSLDPIATAVLSSMKDQTGGMATREELQQAADASKPRPKVNANATEIKDVYTVDELIGEDVVKHIKVRQWQEAFKAEEEVRVKSQYVAHRIQAAAKNPEKLKILRYMLLLLEVYMGTRINRGGRNLPRKDEMNSYLGDMPEVVIESVKRKFSDGGVMSKFKVDGAVFPRDRGQDSGIK